MSDSGIHINNGGLILVWPFLEALFGTLEYTENNIFKSLNHQTRAAALLQLFNSATNDQSDAVLNKVICGISIHDEIELNFKFNPKELDEVEVLLTAMITHWKAVKNMNNNSFKSQFINRNGVLKESESNYELTLEYRTIDILMDSLPWSFSTIQLPWMKKKLFVDFH